MSSLLVGPDDFGWWIDRQRRLTVLILKSGGKLQADMNDFKRMFFRARSCGSYYLPLLLVLLSPIPLL